MKLEDPLPAQKIYTDILNYEPFTNLFKKLTKKPYILNELDVQTVQFIFKYSKNPNPKPFYYEVKEVEKILIPTLKQTEKYFPKNEVLKILELEGFYTPEDMEDLIKNILKRIAEDYPEQAKLWKITQSENPKQKGFKILANKYTIQIPAVAREASEIPGTIYHEILTHVLRRIKRDFNGYEAEKDYIIFEEGLANLVEQFVDSDFDLNAKIKLTQYSYRPLFMAMSEKIGIERTIKFFKTILKMDEFREGNLKNILSRTLLNAKGKKLQEILKMEEKRLNPEGAKYFEGSLRLLEWAKMVNENLNDKPIQNLNKNLLEGKFDPFSVLKSPDLQKKYFKILN